MHACMHDKPELGWLSAQSREIWCRIEKRLVKKEDLFLQSDLAHEHSSFY